jgi:hypothetical protein
MTLAADVKDRNGRVLLAAGAEITEKHIRIFRMWGATGADIEGVAREQIISQAAAAIDPALLREAETQIASLFGRANKEHPAMNELFRLATLRTVEKRMKGARHDG